MKKPKKESKSERFVRVVEGRVNKIIKMIRLIGNCSNTANYEFTSKNVEQTFATLHTELEKTKLRFKLAMMGKSKFSLSDEPETDKYYPEIILPLPDGTSLRAMVIDDEDFPAINIDLLDKDGVFSDHICFAEYNTEKGPCYELNVGVYQSDSEETKYYNSFVPEHSYSYSIKDNKLCVWEDDKLMAEISDVLEENAETIFKDVVFEMRSIDLDKNKISGVKSRKGN